MSSPSLLETLPHQPLPTSREAPTSPTSAASSSRKPPLISTSWSFPSRCLQEAPSDQHLLVISEQMLQLPCAMWRLSARQLSST